MHLQGKLVQYHIKTNSVKLTRIPMNIIWIFIGYILDIINKYMIVVTEISFQKL